MSHKKISIDGTGMYLPKTVSSESIETKYGIPKGWSERYSGVKCRHHVTDETNGLMGARAAEDALKAASIGLADIDMLISASGSFDYPIPNQASMIKHHLTEGNAYDFPAIDIDVTCLSFVAAMDMASRILDGITYSRILIVSSEIASKGLDSSNFETTTLFGDGAAAVVLSFKPDGNSAFIKGQFKNHSEGAFYSIIEGGGNVNHISEKPYNEGLYSFKMEGKKLLRQAKAIIPSFIDSFFSDIPYSLDDVDVIVPHQASRAGLEMFKRMHPASASKIIDTLAETGNCIAASIPISLHMAIQNGKLNRGDTCLLIGTGAGLSIGALLLEY